MSHSWSVRSIVITVVSQQDEEGFPPSLLLWNNIRMSEQPRQQFEICSQTTQATECATTYKLVKCVARSKNRYTTQHKKIRFSQRMFIMYKWFDFKDIWNAHHYLGICAGFLLCLWVSWRQLACHSGKQEIGLDGILVCSKRVLLVVLFKSVFPGTNVGLLLFLCQWKQSWCQEQVLLPLLFPNSTFPCYSLKSEEVRMDATSKWAPN